MQDQPNNETINALILAVENIIGQPVGDRGLFITAFIHRSYLNEHRGLGYSHNERLEFLGDAVLELIISYRLFTHFSDKPEGDLTNFRSALVNAATLSRQARLLHFGQYLFLSQGEDATGGREREYILANTFEAFLGALYLDKGFDVCAQFVDTYLWPEIDPIVHKRLYKDSKSHLQEITQEKYSMMPIYTVLRSYGPDHDKKFEVGVFLGKKQLAIGIGASKQRAELQAAASALEKLN